MHKRVVVTAALLAVVTAPAAACTGLGTDQDQQAAPSPTTAPPTTTSEVLPDQALGVASEPSGAELTIHTADGATITDETPFEGEVPGGTTEIVVEGEGYQPKVRELTLDQPHELTLWLDPERQLLDTDLRFDTGANPKQVAFTPDGSEIWSSLLGPGVQVFDAATGEQLADIELGDHGAVEVIFTADGSRAYTSQMETASVFEIDTETHEVLRDITVDGVWTKVLALSPDEGTLYASNWVSNDVSEINLDEWEVSRVIPTVTTPRGLYPTPDGERLYVAGYGAGEIQRIDLDTGEGTVVHSSGGAARHLVGDGTTVYASDMATAKVYAVDIATDEVRTLTDTDEKPNTIGLSPDGAVLFVSCRGANNPVSYYEPGPEWGTVLAVDTASGDLLDAVVAGNQTTGLAVSDDGSRLAVSDFLDHHVRVYRVPSYAEFAAGDGGRAGEHRQDVPK